ncbi:MAG: hypothetical protein WDZ69_01090 [Candidatus Pacearchaeota archaeon]
MKKTGLDGANFGKVPNMSSGNSTIDLMNKFSLSDLDTTKLDISNNLGTTRLSVNQINTLNISSNHLLGQSPEQSNQTGLNSGLSHSLSLMTLPYGHTDSENCLRQFFDRAERRFNK